MALEPKRKTNVGRLARRTRPRFNIRFSEQGRKLLRRQQRIQRMRSRGMKASEEAVDKSIKSLLKRGGLFKERR